MNELHARFPRLKPFSTLALSLALALSACGASSGGGGNGNVAAAPGISQTDIQTGPISIPKGARTHAIDALLYSGPGTWSDEVEALRALLKEKGASYKEVGADELEAMTVEDLALYGAIVWPGGSGGTQYRSLNSAARERLRKAVREKGVSWVGFCAGAFVAVAPDPAPGKDASYGFSIVAGPELDYYYLELEGTGLAMTMATFADGTKRDITWYGGPVTPSGSGIVVAKYPNGDANISQMWSGNGLVILSAGHPGIYESTKSGLGLNDSDGSDRELTWQLISSAIHQKEMPVFN